MQPARCPPRGSKVHPGGQPCGKHAYRTAQARTESLELNGAPGPRGKGVGSRRGRTGPLRAISARKSQHFRKEDPFTEDLCLPVENTQYTELKKTSCATQFLNVS